VRILICDDEPLALDRLSDLLGQCPDAELVGSYSSSHEALERILSLKPDLVMLDVEMPRLDGFDLVEALSRRMSAEDEATPLVCFVTAYPQFASAAFDSGALDFLCKPVRLHRLRKTLDRAHSALEQREAVRRLGQLSAQLDDLRRATRPEEDRSLWIYHGPEIVRVDIDGLDWLQAEGEYVRLHAGERSYLFRAPLSRLADQLAPHGFIRIHRSSVVNSARIAAIRRLRGGLKVSLSSGVELPVGRRFRETVSRLPLSAP
jgi:DNA-binding LytR/AlgR family response regulator